MRRLTITLLFAAGVAACTDVRAQGAPGVLNPDTLLSDSLTDVTVAVRRSGTVRLAGAENGFNIGREELFRAACCNLGESFTTNPSVDVSYSDATTGARQIRLLGLSGTYVQMLAEQLPAFRGSALPYALGYVPGPWMQAIQVSKGASSVRNGFESVTGQINIDYLKPEAEEGAALNLYANSKARIEANADANLHIRGRVNTELLAHYEDEAARMDENGDGFVDLPAVRQVNVQNRWDYLGRRYIFHGGLGVLDERREGGQKAGRAAEGNPPYRIDVDTRRYEAYMKHAFVLNRERGTNIALMASGTLHRLDALFGRKAYDTDEKNGYLQLLFETEFSPMHSLSAGLSLNHDRMDERLTTSPTTATDQTLSTPNSPLSTPDFPRIPRETTPGAYAQYTLTASDRLTVMAGLRADHSSLYGTFVTPRAHVRYAPHDILTLRLSAGKGYRSPRPLAENHYLLASGRRLVIDTPRQESAWNTGVSAAFYLPLAGRTLKLNLEYYYTHFLSQLVTDYDSDPGELRLTNLDGRSYSHTFQVDATCTVLEGLELTAAWRLNDVRTTYGGRLLERPLTSRYKALLTASYKTPLGLWQVDLTCQLNGGGRLPATQTTPEGRFPAYPQLNVQATRWFRHVSVYVGGENLTNYRQRQPILAADRPWSTDFEPTMVWGPVHGATAYAGLRVNLGRRM